MNTLEINKSAAYVAVIEMTAELSVFTDALIESGCSIDSDWVVIATDGRIYTAASPKKMLQTYCGRAYRRNVYTGQMTPELVKLAQSLNLLA